MWPLSACRSAFANKISPKSDNRSMSYYQKSDFQHGGRRHLEFSKNSIFQSGLTISVVYRISSKSDNFSQIYGDLTIFKMAAVRHLGLKKLQYLSCSPRRHAVLLPHTKFR